MNKQEIFKQIVTTLKNQKTDEKQEKIATNMENLYGTPEGIINSFMVRTIDNKFFETTDIRLISQFIMEALKVLGRGEMINDVLTKGEQNEAKQYDFNAYAENRKIKLPIEFEPVVKVNNMYSTKITANQIAGLIGEGIINYNFDIQREAKLEIRTDKIIKKPTINQRNVNEMEKHLLNETLKESTIYLNAAPMTSKEGEELIYYPTEYKLMITEGTRLDVLDGFHRILAAQKASMVNPNIEFEFNVMFSNFTTTEAIKWQAQHSKATVWSQNRITEMQQESKASKVVKSIKDSNFELEKMIFTGKTITTGRDSLITFKYLEEIVEQYFNIETRRDEVLVIEQLSKILTQINDIKEINKSFRSQKIVEAFIKLFVEDFNKDFNAFTDFMDNIYNQNLKNEITFSSNITEVYNNLKTLKKERI